MLRATPTFSSSFSSALPDLAPAATLRDLYEYALRRAAKTPFSGAADDAWQRLFTLNAAFYLGYWLAPEQHESLLLSLLAQPFGLLGLPLPYDQDHRIQAAQHVAEISQVAGVQQWAQDYGAPEQGARQIEHDQAALAAAQRLLVAPRSSGALQGFLAAHAKRRLWQIAQGFAGANPSLADQTIRYMRQLARVAAARRDWPLIQLTEAILTEREELVDQPNADLLLDALSTTSSRY